MLTADKLLARGHLALDWAASLVDDEVGFRDAGNIINGYYKSVVAFTTGGRVSEARRIANYIEKTFLVNGDINALEGDPTGPGFSNYRNAWLGRGVHVLGRYDLSRALGNFIEGQIDPLTGGLFADPHAPAEKRETCWGSTGSGVLALIAMGRLAAAQRAGDYMIAMMDDQPDAKGKLYLRRDASGKIIDKDIREGLALVYSIEMGTPGQVYWYVGMAMNACANLYLATGDRKWIDGGYKAFEYFKNCHEEIYQIISNGKVAWGLAAMYAVTGDAQFKKHALDAWQWHYDVQSPDGRWLRVGQIASLEEQPVHITLDTTLERAFYMFELSRTLDI